MKIVVGRIYKSKSFDELVRIIKTNSHYFVGRGCTPQTSIPYNYYTSNTLKHASREEINKFLEAEIKNKII